MGEVDAKLITCPICFDIFTNVLMISCGHNFCERCLFDHSLYNKKCPVCRKLIVPRQNKENKNVNMIIKEYIKIHTEFQERYLEKIDSLDKWKKGLK